MSKINNLEDFKNAAEKVCTHFAQKGARYDFNHINLQLLQLIKIDYFGSMSAIAFAVKAQTNPDGSVLLTPHVSTSSGMIYQAILNYKTNWNVVMQKNQIRISPRLITTETKTQAQREVRGYAEEAKVGFRQLRHDLLKFWKNAEISETEQKQNERLLQNLFQEAVKQLEDSLQKQLKRIQNF